jgi:hypothetical protein
MLNKDMQQKQSEDSAFMVNKRHQQLQVKQELLRQIKEQHQSILDLDNPGNKEYALNQKVIR